MDDRGLVSWQLGRPAQPFRRVARRCGQQYELVDRNFYQVIIREKLWDQGVRFGAGFDQARQIHIILIDPGLSQLSARQILDRLLGR